MATFGEVDAALRSITPPLENGERLLNVPEVLIRIEELRHENEVMCRLRRQEVLEFLTKIVRTAPIQVTPDSPLAEEVHQFGDSLIAKMPSKLEALALVSWICGWGGSVTPSPRLAERALAAADPPKTSSNPTVPVAA